MKKYILSLIAISTISFSACRKGDANKADDNATGAYQPFTTGSTWSYRNETESVPGLASAAEADIDTTVNTMTDATKVYNGKIFHKLISVTGIETESTYFGFTNHIYYNHSFNEDADAELELPYLNEETAVNGTWVTPLLVEGAPDSQLLGTIVEKNISKPILGKTYNNVVHSKLELQSKIGGTFTTIFSFDFYVAKNIGVVGIYTSYNGTQFAKSELISYSIK
nr:hypothetical protein [uncultured Mucilaginibacter sp.]